MNGTQAKKIMVSYGSPIFEELGYFHKKSRDTEALFIKKNETGFEDIGISTLNYSPEVMLRFGTGKRLDVVENVLKELSTVVEIKETLLKKDATTFNIIDKQRLYLTLDGVDTEAGVEESMDLIIDYMKTYAIPMFDKFEDLREINKIINGEGEFFWKDDYANTIPFNLAHDFDSRRLIIGRLCLNDEDFKIAMKSTKNISKHHPQDFQNKVLKEYNNRLEKLGITV